MEIEQEILINKYGQSLIDIGQLLNLFNGFDLNSKRNFLDDLLFLILQSKAQDDDIDQTILDSGLKGTYTACVLLRKSTSSNNLKNLSRLPENELNKVLILLMNLFKIAYKRRFEVERNNPDKWWYWDMSDEINIAQILQMNGS